MSHERADIRSTDLVEKAHAALTGFIEAGRLAVYEIQSDVDRTIQWLQNERRPHWTRTVKRRTEEMNRAKQNLIRKQMKISAKDGRTPDSEEKLLLRRAQDRLESALDRQKKTTSWIRKLEHERILMKGYLSPVTLVLESELPQASAILRKIAETLDEYLALSPLQLRQAMAPPTSATDTETDGEPES